MADEPTNITPDSKHLNPVDDSVHIPDSVKRAGAVADAMHAEAYKTEPVADTAADTAAPTAPASDATPAPAASAAPATPAPAAPATSAPAPAEPVAPEQWEHRYNSMKGRYDQATSTIGSMQQQMQDMGDELTRMQQLFAKPGQTPQTAQGPQKFLTDADRTAYGDELLDTVQRAALEAVAPQLSELEQRNRKLAQQVSRERQNSVYGELRAALPNWEEVNTNPRFVNWLRLRNVYSGAVRQNELKQAFQAHDAPRVIAFFKGFINDEVATGQVAPASQTLAAPLAPRVAALDLAALTAPGKARPATGDTQLPAEKPIFTLSQISRFYSQAGRAAYVGRDADRKSDEREIFAAQREGRVR